MLDPTQMPMPREPMSGNAIPPGALPEEVRDDVDIKASEGEYVLPADVVRYIGLEKIEAMVNKAQKDLQSLAEGGRIGGKPLPPEAPPMAPEGPPMGPPGMAEGGMVNTSLPQATMQAYMGPNGDIVYVPVLNGQPIATVPQGYTPTDNVPQQATPTSNARSRDRASGKRDVRTSTPVEQWTPEQWAQYGRQAESGVGDFITGAASALVPGFGLINRMAENSMRNTAPGVLQNMIDSGVDAQGNPITEEQMNQLRSTQSTLADRFSSQSQRRNPLQMIGDFFNRDRGASSSSSGFTREGSNVRTGQRKSTPPPTSEGFSSSGDIRNLSSEDEVKKAFFSGGMVTPPMRRQPTPIQPPATRNPRVGFMNKRNPR